MMRPFAVIALAVAALTTPASAQVDWDRIDLDAERAAIAQFQSFDQRLQDVGWRLVRGNAAFCDNVTPSIGLQLQDMASYGAPDVARRALGLKRDFAVQTAAAGSPSAQSAAFPTNREVTLLGAIDPNQWEASPRLNWQRLKLAHDHVDGLLRDEGAIKIGFADGETVEVAAVPVCASRFELMGRGDRAVATGDRVVIGIEFPAFGYDEPVFAGLIAHELAHNLLGHRAWLDRNGRSRGNVRRAESEADRLMPWLLANVGYDPVAAAEFFETYRPTSGGLLFIPGTHRRWQDRAALARDEIAAIAAQRDGTGKADWRRGFRRDIDPRSGRDDQD